MLPGNNTATHQLPAGLTRQHNKSARPLHLQLSKAQRTVWAQDHRGSLDTIAGIHHCTRQYVGQIFRGERGWNKRMNRFHNPKAEKISLSIDKAIRRSRGEAESEAASGQGEGSAGPGASGGMAEAPAEPVASTSRPAVVPPATQDQLSLRLAGDALNEMFKMPACKKNDSFGDYIRERRREFGWSQDDLAAAAGVAKTTVWAVENNEPATDETAEKLLTAMGERSEQMIVAGLRFLRGV